MDAGPALAAVYPLPSDGGLIPVDVEPGGDYAGRDLSGADLANADLTGADCRGASFRDSELSGATLTGADCSGAIFRDSDLSGATLTDVDLTGAYLAYASLTGAELTGATISGARLKHATSNGFTQVQLESTASYASGDLRGIDFTHNRMSGWNLAGQDLTGARFRSTWLTDTDFTGATIAGVSFNSSRLTRSQLESTASYANGQLMGITFGTKMDLSNCNFAGMDLTDLTFRTATLTGADFSGATIAGTGFFHTEGFTQAQFESTASYASGRLKGVNLNGLDLAHWDFTGQDLTDARLEWTRLTKADFTGAIIAGVRLTDSHLTRGQFESTASYASGDLRGMRLRETSASGWNLAGKDLTDVDFGYTYLRETDFTGATIRRANFARTTDKGFTQAQFESTASYASDQLAAVDLTGNDLSDWDFSGKDLTDVDFIDTTLAGTDFTGATIAGALFSHTTDGGFTQAQFESTASYAMGRLAGVVLADNDLSGWDFVAKDLTGAMFADATLTGADFTGATITGAAFARTTERGFTQAQLESTASYGAGRLDGINLSGNDLSGWDFAGKDLTNANFYETIVEGTDLSFADLRQIRSVALETAGSTRNTILPRGQIEGLELLADERLVVRDHAGKDLPIAVDTLMSLDPDAFLQMAFADDAWSSTLSFEPGIAVTLGGTLELTLAAEADPAELLGATFGLFDFEGVTPGGQFGQVVTEPGLVWDLSNLYSSGEVTLTAVPEPSTLMLLSLAAAALLAACTGRSWRS